ncbi:MAG: sigma-70 family RNA polymerase sigma factor [Candidatus Eisenbacteria bacterium]
MKGQLQANEGVTDETIARLARGDEGEWARFVRTQGRIINAAGHKVGLTADERDDLVQNTCVVCYHSIDSLRDPSRLGAWVYRIAYRQALEIVRKRPPNAPSEDREGRSILDLMPSGDLSEQAVLERNEQSEQLLQAVSEIGDRCRTLLELLYLEVEVPPYEEVSQRLSMPIGSIGPTRARCLDRLRRKWKQVSGG